jgi:hypothetical protein
MPVIGQTLLSGVLAHRRHDNPVPERDATDRQRTEQVHLGNFPVVVAVGFAAIWCYMRYWIVKFLIFELLRHNAERIAGPR